MRIVEENYWFIAAGDQSGPHYLAEGSDLTRHSLGARRFADAAIARAALQDAQSLNPALDWRVYGSRSKSLA